VQLRQNSQARRMTLRVSQVDGVATLTLPKRTAVKTARRFVENQEDWLRQQLNRVPARVGIKDGSEIPFRGKTLKIVLTPGRAVHLKPPVLEVATPNPGPRLKAFLKNAAREAILPMAEQYCAEIGRPLRRINLRDTRSRWGSCSSDGNLMFSWRLIMAPPAVLEYVVVHEVAHLLEMNHSPAFWKVVARLMPEYATQLNWLRAHGTKLHNLSLDT